MPTGTVKWFNDDKGYGFIESQGELDVFVHWKEIQVEGFKSLKEGEVVDYETTETPKGIQAVNVRKRGANES
jgi:CspA family cold shock protein